MRGVRLGLWRFWIALPGLLLWSLAACAVADPPGRGVADPFDTVAIDPGHGGDDLGARGARGLAEKDLVLDVSKRLARRLQRHGLRVLLTREDDRFVALDARNQRANEERADLFLSIHANAARSREPAGVETFFLSLEASDEASRRLAERENRSSQAPGTAAGRPDSLAALLGDMKANGALRESDVFASLAEAELASLGPFPSRGVKQAPFVVLMSAEMPSALVEIGFVSNPAEELALRKAESREAIAAALARAVITFGKRYDARRGRTARWTESGSESVGGR